MKKEAYEDKVLMEIFLRQADYCYSSCFEKMKNRDFAEAAFKEVFRKLMEKSPGFADEEEERLWCDKAIPKATRRYRKYVSSSAPEEPPVLSKEEKDKLLVEILKNNRRLVNQRLESGGFKNSPWRWVLLFVILLAVVIGIVLITTRAGGRKGKNEPSGGIQSEVNEIAAVIQEIWGKHQEALTDPEMDQAALFAKIQGIESSLYGNKITIAADGLTEEEKLWLTDQYKEWDFDFLDSAEDREN